MESKNMIVRFFSLLIIVAISFQSAGCGTILYPERRGQIDPGVIVHGGVAQIDPGVAILDAVLLVFFVVPGIVAFAVDFSTGAIYLPSKKTGLIELEGNTAFALVDTNSDQINTEVIGAYIKEKTGSDLPLDNSRLFKIKDRKNFQKFLDVNHFEAI